MNKKNNGTWIGKRCFKGEKYIYLEAGGTLPVEGKQVEYIGEVSSLKEVPETFCLFSYQGFLYYREIKFNYNEKKIVKISTRSDGEKMNIPIKPNDDSLMTLVKLIIKELSKDEFRALFKSDAEMNNYKKQLESGEGSLSFKRFNQLINGLDLTYNIEVFGMMDEPLKVSSNNI